MWRACCTLHWFMWSTRFAGFFRVRSSGNIYFALYSILPPATFPWLFASMLCIMTDLWLFCSLATLTKWRDTKQPVGVSNNSKDHHHSILGTAQDLSSHFNFLSNKHAPLGDYSEAFSVFYALWSQCSTTTTKGYPRHVPTRFHGLWLENAAGSKKNNCISQCGTQAQHYTPLRGLQ